jgi:predicted Fe-Mo cluster-binding NifX family protein
MTKIAITSEGPSLDDRVDPRFGRAAGFLVVNPDTMDNEYVDNGDSQIRAQGAGIQAAETVARSGAKAVLTGYVGPKAFQALSAAGIRVAQDLENITIREAVERYKQGDINWAEQSQARGYGR